MDKRKSAMAQPPGFFRPTKEQLLAARKKTVPDVITPNLRCLFVGINPGLYTAAIGHHFGRPGNRFWPALFAGGFTERLLSPFEEQELVKSGFGITNMVARATATADELTVEELVLGGKRLLKKIEKFTPRWVAVVGLGAYRIAFSRLKARVGLQEENLGGARLWLLPNPSGLNAHYQASQLGQLFRDLRLHIDSHS